MQLDIGWRDLGFALRECLRTTDAVAAADAIERGQSSDGRALACLSVRSGFDALLQALALPAGSEVVMSAITIPHMLQLVEAHGLRAVPVAVDTATLAVGADAVERAITPATRLIVVTHLLGSRVPMAPIAMVAARHGIPLIEDAAQSFQGDGYRGDAGSAVTMSSFGAIKTATALGGALLHFGDAALATRVRAVLRAQRPHSRGWYLRRVLRFSAIKLLSQRLPFTLLVRACRTAGLSHERVLRDSVRGFRGNDLLTAVRRAPPAPLLALMRRRLAQDQRSAVQARRASGEHLAACLPWIDRPGRSAHEHSFWVFPIFDRDPDACARRLAAASFDATIAASTLAEIRQPEFHASGCELKPLGGWLYLPQPATMTARERKRLAAALSAREAESGPPCATRK